MIIKRPFGTPRSPPGNIPRSPSHRGLRFADPRLLTRSPSGNIPKTSNREAKTLLVSSTAYSRQTWEITI